MGSCMNGDWHWKLIGLYTGNIPEQWISQYCWWSTMGHHNTGWEHWCIINQLMKTINYAAKFSINQHRSKIFSGYLKNKDFSKKGKIEILGEKYLFSFDYNIIICIIEIKMHFYFYLGTLRHIIICSIKRFRNMWTPDFLHKIGISVFYHWNPIRIVFGQYNN